ncbi:MAG: hypothetical protein K8L97_22670 [Anaerolineae bacterium]|nr:hypothetical protein [Anaerolineae bacterium]
MQFAREINRLLIGILFIFGIVVAAAAYWAIVGPDTILLRQDNPRLVEAEAAILRGALYDRNKELLVVSEQDVNGLVTRHYLHPAMHSALGYSSLRYGVSGAESAFNTILRGEDQPLTFIEQLTNNLLHRPQKGADIQLTFDATIQAAAVEAMGDHRGAVVVLSASDGEVLALVSLPTYDPNTLDANWETLTQTSGNPFFNRPIQGNYQPGGTLQTPLIAAALLANYPLTTTFNYSSRPVRVANVELTCAAVPPTEILTLGEAYAYGCPAPFAELVSKLGIGTVEAAFAAFEISRPPTLPGYVVQPPNEPTPTPSIINLNSANLGENALGQGQLTITPLEMTVIAAAILNDGNAPTPYTLLAVRPPIETAWQNDQSLHPHIPIITTNAARQLQDLMRLSVNNGAAQSAMRLGLDIGGHAALAYSGDESQAWFVGFITIGVQQSITIAVVLEDVDDPALAAQIGGDILEAAYARMQQG